LIDNIKEEKVTPYFQAIYAVDNNTVPYKFESLMRLMDSEGRVLSPTVFMEKSKEYRLYTQLMSQMIDKVFDVLSRYDVSVTLNLSYVDINNTELCDKLMRKVKKMQVGSRLTVEIVESEQIEDLEMVNEFIFALKKSGVLIAIDDFGSGFCNFDNIMKLDVDYVKLDGSLVSKIQDEKYRSILESMVNICHNLGIKTIAEYISDESIMQLAKSIGVDYLQGYHLHKPEHWDSVTETFGLQGDNNA
jgi:EAL domain-containing protein (putative c-di-GMP-specific phosphodiesterase class I)